MAKSSQLAAYIIAAHSTLATHVVPKSIPMTVPYAFRASPSSRASAPMMLARGSEAPLLEKVLAKANSAMKARHRLNMDGMRSANDDDDDEAPRRRCVAAWAPRDG